MKLQKGEWNMNRNAIIMAAGMSTRFVPLSMEVPKALLRVKNEIMIERQIRQLQAAGIDEIVVVVGYMKEKFEYLKEKFGVKLVENPYYQKMNNFSTLYVAREYLKNTFICSADNYFVKNVFKESSEQSYYAAVYEEGKTEEWCLKCNEEQMITKVNVGGNNSWVMKGHVFLNMEFNRVLIPYLESAFATESMWGKYWEDIYIEHMNELKLYMKKFDSGIIEEFDSLDELRRFDSNYINHTGSAVFAKICRELDCREGALVNIIPNKKDGKVTGFQFECHSRVYQYDYQTGLAVK